MKLGIKEILENIWHYPHEELGLIEGREYDLVEKDRS
jgi:hypothetical protein